MVSTKRFSYSSFFLVVFIFFQIALPVVSEESKLLKKHAVFQPTHEWQEVGEDQQVPPGLHIRMDLQLGKKWAKLMDDTKDEPNEKKPETSSVVVSDVDQSQSRNQALVAVDDPPTVDHQCNVDHQCYGDHPATQNSMDEIKSTDELTVQDHTNETHNPIDSIVSTLSSLPQPPKVEGLSLDEARASMSPAEFKKEIARIWKERQSILIDATNNMQDHVDVLKQLIKDVLNENLTTEAILNSLQRLEGEVEDLDKAHDFYKLGGFAVMTRLLDSSSYEIRGAAAWVLGTAVQNYAEAQIWALESNAMQGLLKNLRIYNTLSPEIEKMHKKCLYALSAMVRSNAQAERMLLSNEGIEVLFSLLSDKSTPRIQLKVVALLRDLLDESKESSNKDNVILRIKEKLTSSEWCEVIPSLFSNQGTELWQKVLEAMQSQIPSCVDVFRSQRVQDLLNHVKSTWTLNSEGINGEYQLELLQLVQNVEMAIELHGNVEYAVM